MDIHKCGKVPSLTTRLDKNNVWQTWGVSLAGKICDLLDSRAEAVLPFWSGIFATGLLGYLRRCYWKKCFANLFFPTASMHSQLVGQPPLHSHSTASSPAPRAYKPECYGAFQLSGPLQARTFARKNVRRMLVYLSISLSIYLSACLCLSVYLPS